VTHKQPLPIQSGAKTAGMFEKVNKTPGLTCQALLGHWMEKVIGGDPAEVELCLVTHRWTRSKLRARKSIVESEEKHLVIICGVGGNGKNPRK